MNNAEIKDNHLYITYEVYDYGIQIKRKIIPLEDIECIKAVFGPRGGLHSWSIRGDSAEYRNLYDKRDVPLHSGGRKSWDLIEKIQKLLPDLKYVEETESGGAI